MIRMSDFKVIGIAIIGSFSQAITSLSYRHGGFVLWLIERRKNIPGFWVARAD
jgi:hypothetical protein